ncbi:MAG: undecaprenyl-phosphate galactose phosphotransferase WbaP [Alphaproteobacteria bacterium]|nr:undecaprenyl-phosphate galactose phosphotransferase WbaP [Alphaproteobacteria bacterium]
MKKSLLPLIIGDITGFILTFVFAWLMFEIFGTYHDRALFPYPSHVITINLIVFYLGLAATGILYFMQKGHYKLATPWWQQVKHICNFSFTSLVIFGFFFYLMKGDMSRAFVIISWIGLIPALMIARLVVRARMIAKGRWSVPTYLIGGFENTIETIYALRSEPFIRFKIKAAILPDSTPTRIKRFKEIHENILVKKALPALSPGDFVIISPDTRRELDLSAIIRKVTDAGAEFALVPPVEGFSYYGLQSHYFFGYNIVLLHQNVRLHSLLNQIIKTIMDRIGAVIGLLLLSPLFLYIIFKIKMEDGGPAFFGHKRVGQNGKTFKCWKFRSMVPNAKEVLEELLAKDPAAREEWERDFKLKNDPRITKIGEILRKTSLDEIPQLFNVLRGEMSLVGPRPIVTDEIKYYGDKINDYYAVRPGITGLWQASGRNDVTYALRVYLDSWYVRHWSLWTDIVIVIKTIFVIITGKGAY